MSIPNQTVRKILRLKQVIDRTGLSRSTIYDRMNPKSKRFDKSFPTPYKLNANANSNTGAVGWLESAIDEWIEQRFQSAKKE
jgi:prophage regulatory protein